METTPLSEQPQRHIVRSVSPHLAAALVVLLVSTCGSSYRHLWQDELETAERARTILESGVPLVVDERGLVSTNAGGREIEDGDLHRYTPWVQFYVGAIGLAVARGIGASEDAGLRAPFAASHAATTGMLSYGLCTLGGVSAPVAAVVGVLFGLETVRLAHARTARYHALLDLFACVGLIGLGAARTGRRSGAIALAAAIFLSPQTHTLGGSVTSLALGVLALCGAWRPRGGPGPLDGYAGLARFVVLPGLASLVLLLVLTRPWLQDAWSGGSFGFRAFHPLAIAAVPVGFLAICSVASAATRRWRHALALATTTLVIILAIRSLDAFAFSQWRYYLSVAVVAVGWPIALGLPSDAPRWRVAWSCALLVASLAPDLVFGRHVDDRQFSPYRPFHGARVAFDDRLNARRGVRQPLHEAIDHIRSAGTAGEAVLFDYVPQFVGWYLSDRSPALVPDISQMNSLNADHRIWRELPRFPDWHAWYATMGGGFWACGAGCDFRAQGYAPDRERYVLSSRRLRRSEEMCVVRRWMTDKYNNAPFHNVGPHGMRPDGGANDVLVLARRCRAQTKSEVGP